MSEELPTGTHKVCPRCGSAAPEDIWCGSCGLNLRQAGDLPTADAFAASQRERTWLETQQREQRAARKQHREEAATQRRQRRERTAALAAQRQAERRERSAQRRERLRAPLRIAALVGPVLVVAAATIWLATDYDAPVLGVSPLHGGKESSDAAPGSAVRTEGDEGSELPDAEVSGGAGGSASAGQVVEVACYAGYPANEIRFKASPRKCSFTRRGGQGSSAETVLMESIVWTDWGEPIAQGAGEIFVMGGGFVPGEIELTRVGPHCGRLVYTRARAGGQPIPLDACPRSVGEDLDP